MTSEQKAIVVEMAVGIVLTLMLASLAIGMHIGRKTAPKCPQINPADTTFVADTSHHEDPKPAEVTPAGYELIKVGTVAQLKKTIAALEAAAAAAAVPQPADTTQAAGPAPPVDSAQVEVPLPIERKVYGGKEGDDYRAVISGIFPKLESIDVYPKTAYITIPVQEPARRKARVGFGITAGPGVYWNGSGIQPGLGATVGLTLGF